MPSPNGVLLAHADSKSQRCSLMGQYDPELLERIWRRTDGRCHLCRKKLGFHNYAQPGKRGAWEREHSRPRAKGGSDHLNNLYPAHIACNRAKGTLTSRTVRRYYGHRHAPMSRERKQEARESRTAVAAGVGLFLGAALGGPPIAFVFALVGGALASSSVPSNT